jgi:transcription elongation GreA/GreB family factor
VAIGKLKVKELDLFVISSESPLAKKLIGLKINNKVEINSKFFVIENIF